MSPKKSEPAEFELQILGILWEHGPQTVRQVMELLNDGEDRAYTSVLSVMQVMHKKGMLKTQKKRSGLAHVYQANVKRDRVMKPILRSMVTRVFGGRAQDAVQQLLGGSDVTKEDIAELRALLNDLEEQAED